MKKILSILLVAVMLLSLCACGSDDSVGEPLPVESSPNFSVGRTSGNTYKNEFLGLTIKVPDDWKFYSDSEILAINNVSKEYHDKDTLALLEQADVVYDMYAFSASGEGSVTITLKKLGSLKEVAGTDTKAKIEADFDMLNETLKNVGYTDIEIAYVKVPVDGNEIDGYTIKANLYGLWCYSTAIVFTRGNYSVDITVTTLTEGGEAEIFDGFDFD